MRASYVWRIQECESFSNSEEAASPKFDSFEEPLDFCQMTVTDVK